MALPTSVCFCVGAFRTDLGSQKNANIPVDNLPKSHNEADTKGTNNSINGAVTKGEKPRTHTYAHIHTRARECTYTCTHTRARTHTHSHTHTHTHKHTHTHTHKHTNTHTLSLSHTHTQLIPKVTHLSIIRMELIVTGTSLWMKLVLQIIKKITQLPLMRFKSLQDLGLADKCNTSLDGYDINTTNRSTSLSMKLILKARTHLRVDLILKGNKFLDKARAIKLV